MKLYFFSCTHPADGTSLDWFVQTRSAAEATTAWLEQINAVLCTDDEDLVTLCEPSSPADQGSDARIYSLSDLGGTPGIVDWGKLPSMRLRLTGAGF